MSVKVGLVSLCCAKNLIDSEIMIGHLAKAGMSMTPDAAEADVVIVNTCRRESRDGARCDAEQHFFAGEADHNQLFSGTERSV